MTQAAGQVGAPLRPERGLRLGGRYELRSRIAVGGMGEVWITRDLSLERSVATKVLREDLAGDDRFLARLRAEARTSAPLAHPNIAALYDYGEQAGSGYLVMELVHGETLAQLLERERILDAEALLPVLAQTARALHAAHVCGVVHRDVKPSNILLTRDGRVKITDFGISLASNRRDVSAEGTVMGTAQYLAPEQAMGLPAMPASDIYGLGVVAYEALAGRRPFTGRSLEDIASAHVNEAVPPLPASVPDPVRTVVLAMLDKQPQRRPRSAASLARTLDRIAKELELARPFAVEPAHEYVQHGGAHAAARAAPRRGPAAVPSLAGDRPTHPEGSAHLAGPAHLDGPARRNGAAHSDLDTSLFDVEASFADAPPVRRPADAADAQHDAQACSDDDPPLRWVPVGAAVRAVPPGKHRHRPSSRARRAAHRAVRSRRWWIPLMWVAVFLVVAMTAALVLTAGRLGRTVGSAPVDGRSGLWQVATGVGPASPHRGDRAVGDAPGHLTEVEDSSW